MRLLSLLADENIACGEKDRAQSVEDGVNRWQVCRSHSMLSKRSSLNVEELVRSIAAFPPHPTLSPGEREQQSATRESPDALVAFHAVVARAKEARRRARPSSDWTAVLPLPKGEAE